MIEGQDKTTITRQPSQPQSTHNHYHPAHRTRDKDNELDDSGCVLTKGTGHPMSCLAITFTTQQINSKRRIFAWLYCLAALGVNLLSQPPNTTKRITDIMHVLARLSFSSIKLSKITMGLIEEKERDRALTYSTCLPRNLCHGLIFGRLCTFSPKIRS